MLLYLINDHPSVSETFAVTEAAAVARQGWPTVCYALKKGSADASAAEVDLICDPASRARLLWLMIRNLLRVCTLLWKARDYRPSGREMARLILAEALAAHAARACRHKGITHIHAHFLARPADVGIALSERLQCQWTATAHGSDIYAPGEPALLARRLDRVAAVACANHGLLQRVPGLVDSRAIRTRVVHCGVDTTALSYSAAGHVHPPHHIVTIGRLVETKGHWSVLDCAAALMADDPTLRWTIIGDGPLRDALTRDPRCLRFAPRLRYAGALNHRQALASLTNATAFVLPCQEGPDGESDGIPVALMEAMALGVPVITTAVGGIPELVISGKTGVLVPPQDSGALAAATRQILASAGADLSREACDAARRKVEDDFDIDKEAMKLLDFLQLYVGSIPTRAGTTPVPAEHVASPTALGDRPRRS